MKNISRAAARRLFAAGMTIYLVGCAVMTSNEQLNEKARAMYLDKSDDSRFSFKKHSFSALSFNTQGCKVIYADTYQINRSDDEISPPRSRAIKEYLNSSHAGIRNFPSPASVRWRSKDGQEHQASIDIASIFRDQRVLHNVPGENIAPSAYVGEPHIVLVVDDRTISVYIATYIPLKNPRVPTNPNSDYIDEPIVAFAKTY